MFEALIAFGLVTQDFDKILAVRGRDFEGKGNAMEDNRFMGEWEAKGYDRYLTRLKGNFI